MCVVGLHASVQTPSAEALTRPLGSTASCSARLTAAPAAIEKGTPVKGPTVDRKRPIKVYVTDEDRAVIEARAEATRLSLSDYLRNVGLAYQPRSAFDHEAVRALAKVNGDLGRLGGLLKMWLADSPGVGAREGDVQRLLEQIRETAAEVREGMQRV